MGNATQKRPTDIQNKLLVTSGKRETEGQYNSRGLTDTNYYV